MAERVSPLDLASRVAEKNIGSCLHKTPPGDDSLALVFVGTLYRKWLEDRSFRFLDLEEQRILVRGHK